ncbi:unnamed protein product [Vitrella brassicaformis CCMP3155]|uniref:Uncharacterized protein n=1 Tax=Vitrella brassicaformis (strain CCMP3155) TaxID=1169540 RepID=A0A0G4EWJ1_VITBC|nr:unnamed protein product [Vitrella brassicaformis CCMP3155]|eukprot:CEM02623.1 unnamed protein product [Vitrella brassicaformis CCMP3155]
MDCSCGSAAGLGDEQLSSFLHASRVFAVISRSCFAGVEEAPGQQYPEGVRGAACGAAREGGVRRAGKEQEKERAPGCACRDLVSHQRRAEEAERVGRAAAEQKLKATLVELGAAKLLESSLRAGLTGAATREMALVEQLREAHRQRREAQEQLREAHRQRRETQELQQQAVTDLQTRAQTHQLLRALQSQLDQGAEQLAQAEQTAMDDQRRESGEKAGKDRSRLEQQITAQELEFKKKSEALESHNAHVERQLKAANQKHDEELSADFEGNAFWQHKILEVHVALRLRGGGQRKRKGQEKESDTAPWPPLTQSAPPPPASEDPSVILTKWAYYDPVYEVELTDGQLKEAAEISQCAIERDKDEGWLKITGTEAQRGTARIVLDEAEARGLEASSSSSSQRRAEEAERVAKAAAEQKLKATLVELEAAKVLESSLRAGLTSAATRDRALEEQLREAHRQSEGKLRALQSHERDAYISEVQSERDALTKQCQALQEVRADQHTDLQHTCGRQEADIEALKSELAETRTVKQEMHTELTAAKEDLQSERSALAVLQRAHDDLKAQTETLEDTLRSTQKYD